MGVNTGKPVGLCEADNSGKIIKLEREFFQQGWSFKSRGAFRDRMDAPCYVPELEDTVYTRRDFLELCRGQEEIAEESSGNIESLEEAAGYLEDAKSAVEQI